MYERNNEMEVREMIRNIVYETVMVNVTMELIRYMYIVPWLASMATEDHC